MDTADYTLIQVTQSLLLVKNTNNRELRQTVVDYYANE